MNKLLFFILSLLLTTSCAEQYNIAGNSSVPCLDGRMLYLKVSPEGAPRSLEARGVCIDSCKVIHGRFNFMGSVDSVMMGMLYTDKQCVMPVVIENGNLNIQVDNVAQRVSGGPLNDRLYDFFKKRNRMDNEMWELQQKSMRMMREGSTPMEIEKKLGRKMQKLTRQTEELETNFVKDNYQNVLGPGFFLLLCSQYPTPIMTEQIKNIIDNAPDAFLHHPYVSGYLHQARARMNAVPIVSTEVEGTTTGTTTTTTITITYP